MKTAPLELLQELVPDIYNYVAETHGVRTRGTDLSRSNLCNVLSFELQTALASRKLESRREHHHTGNTAWHYLVAHAGIDEPPSPYDIITDLNPWRFEGCPEAKRGFLHGQRQEVQSILEQAGAPEWYVSLRGISTIIEAHTLLITPKMQSRDQAPDFITSGRIVRTS